MNSEDTSRSDEYWMDIENLRRANTMFLEENETLKRKLKLALEAVKAWNECPKEHFFKVWDQPQMSGQHRSEYRQKINDAMNALEAAGVEI